MSCGQVLHCVSFCWYKTVDHRCDGHGTKTILPGVPEDCSDEATLWEAYRESSEVGLVSRAGPTTA